MRRVDPDCVDSLFAEYDSESWTGTSSANVSGGPSQELELLSGVDAIIDFIQAAQNSFSETAHCRGSPFEKIIQRQVQAIILANLAADSR